MIRTTVLSLFVLLGAANIASALVRYDEGRLFIEGVVLLQDAQDEKAYYYLPQYPRLATQPDGKTLEFLCVKYVGEGDATSGGLFHALVEFGLPDGLEARVARELARQVSGATLRGPVPLLEAVEDGEQGMGSFRIVSGTLSDTGEGGLTRSVLTSGRAPLTPGSKAVVAARLSPEGATLLWETLRGPTSDVSVAITAYYEAAVRGYNARVSAQMDTLYDHFSEFANAQLGYSKSEIQSRTDELVRSGGIEVEVLDRSQGLELDASQMDRLVDLVTTRLTDLMFDTSAGWSRAPEAEAAAGEGAGPERREQGWLEGVLNLQDQPYVTDLRYELKARSDIQRSSFEMNLSRSTTIRVPVDSAGNLGGLFDEFENDERYFRIVNLADPVFEKRLVHFQVDGTYLDSFQDTLNFVSVNFRKRVEGQPAITDALVFTHEDIQKGRTIQSVAYARLGEQSADWRSYEYQVRWSVRDRETVSVPEDPDVWLESEDPAVALIPPFEKRTIEIDADRDLFKEANVATAVVEFAVPLAGKPKLLRKATLRARDAEPTSIVSIYHDRGAPVAWRVTWHSRAGLERSEARELESEYLYLVPPSPKKTPANDSDER